MYKYKDNVKIIKGFYEGLKGRLVDINSDFDDSNQYKQYNVEIIIGKVGGTCPIRSKTVRVPEEYLRKI